MGFQIDQDGAEVLAFAARPIVDAQHGGGGVLRQEADPNEAQQGRGTSRHADQRGHGRAQRRTDGQGQRLQLRSQAGGAPRRRPERGTKPLGEDAAPAGGVVAKEAADVQHEVQRVAGSGQIGGMAGIVAMDAGGRVLAAGTTRGARDSGEFESDPLAPGGHG